MTPKIIVLKDLGYKIKLTKAPIGDPKLKYRKEVERRVDQGQLSSIVRSLLKRRRDELGLSSEEADAIEAEVLQPYREHQDKLKEYEDELVEALQQENPLSDRTRNDLRDYQQHLGLTDEHVKEIKERLADTIPSKSHEETDELPSEKGVDYTKLRDLLASGQWKDADRETLDVMLKVAGREQERWLRIEDIEKFPCTDLRTIDTLWVKYSKGRFGFSVQKRIWESVGGTPDADYETYKRFGDRVGWRVKNNWLEYHLITFSETAPEGNLPVRADFVAAQMGGRIERLSGWGMWWYGVVGSLFSRVKTCRL